MIKPFRLLIILFLLVSVLFCEPPPRDGMALGYMTTPNSIVYRSPFSDERAADFWLDIPEFTIGEVGAFRIGCGAGYAMFLVRQDDFAFMLRPQVSFAYIEQGYHRGEIALGVAGAVTAYLDHIGLEDVDVYAGISLGSTIELGEDFTAFHLILSRQEPFGILIGVMKYF